MLAMNSWYQHDPKLGFQLDKETFILHLLRFPGQYTCSAGFEGEEFIGWCWESPQGAFYCRGFEFDMLHAVWAGNHE
jgi:hypothetical protein